MELSGVVVIVSFSVYDIPGKAELLVLIVFGERRDLLKRFEAP